MLSGLMAASTNATDGGTVLGGAEGGTVTDELAVGAEVVLASSVEGREGAARVDKGEFLDAEGLQGVLSNKLEDD